MGGLGVGAWRWGLVEGYQGALGGAPVVESGWKPGNGRPSTPELKRLPELPRARAHEANFFFRLLSSTGKRHLGRRIYP